MLCWALRRLTPRQLFVCDCLSDCVLSLYKLVLFLLLVPCSRVLCGVTQHCYGAAFIRNTTRYAPHEPW